MPKQCFPERPSVRLPEGTCARIRSVMGVDPSHKKSGQDITGPILRKWILDRLLVEEAQVTIRLEPVLEPAPDDLEAWLGRARSLLLDAVTRDRFQRRIEMSEDDRRRRGISAAANG